MPPKRTAPLDLGTWGSYGTEQLHLPLTPPGTISPKASPFPPTATPAKPSRCCCRKAAGWRCRSRPPRPRPSAAASRCWAPVRACSASARTCPTRPGTTPPCPGRPRTACPAPFEEISTAAERACSRAQNAEDAAALAQTSAQVAQAAAQDAVRVAASAQKNRPQCAGRCRRRGLSGRKADLRGFDRAGQGRPAPPCFGGGRDGQQGRGRAGANLAPLRGCRWGRSARLSCLRTVPCTPIICGQTVRKLIPPPTRSWPPLPPRPAGQKAVPAAASACRTCASASR